jgi:hypothetical protein
VVYVATDVTQAVATDWVGVQLWEVFVVAIDPGDVHAGVFRGGLDLAQVVGAFGPRPHAEVTELHDDGRLDGGG